MLDFETAGSVMRSQQILAEWGEAGKHAMWWQLALDTPFAISYGLLFAGCCVAVGRRARAAGRTGPETAARVFAWLAPLAAAADLAQNLSLGIVLAGSSSQPWPHIAALAAPTTMILVGSAAVFAAVGALATRHGTGRRDMAEEMP